MVIEELFTRLGFQVDPKGIDKAKQALTGFKSFVGGLALGAGFTMLAKTGIEAAMTMESLSTSFKVMTGSAERAQSTLQQISEFAKSTPFSKMGLAGAAKTLMAFGLQAEEVVPTLRMLGDVAQGDQNRLNSLALVFGQIQSTGKLMGQDLLQLINQSFNPLTIISQKTGISMADLKDAMSQGAISADMVTLAFKAATSEGGMFYRSTEEASKTLEGRLSTLKDNLRDVLMNIAEAFMPAMKAGVDFLLTVDFRPAVVWVQNFVASLRDIPNVFKPIVTWAQRLAPLMLVIFGPAIQAHILKYVAAVKSATVASSAFAAIQTIIQRAALASGAAMGYQVTAMGLLKSAMFSIKQVGVSAFKALGLAMKTALGPIGIALMAIEGFVAAYKWLEGRSIKKATEEQTAWGRKWLEQQHGKGQTYEEIMENFVGQQEERRSYAKKLMQTSALGGEKGRQAEKELEEVRASIKQNEAFEAGLLRAYQEMSGMEWERKVQPTMLPPPASMTGDTAELEKAFANLEKEIKENTKATKKNTKARKQKPFDISALSRQAFDAAFNVKLKEFAIGAI